MTVAAGPLKRERTFFGEPRGLAYLAFTEAWERFSYYGMVALLVLYMSQALFMPGHIEHVAGFTAFRHGLESIFGPMSTLALASQVYGLYTGFVYFTPVFGGLIADRWLGRRNAVVLGAILMSCGHFAMAFDQSFLLALLLLIVGCGLLKGNISTQVGSLYAEDDGAGRTRGFSIFSIGINVGSVAGPILCGALAQYYGWHAGFGLAGVLMLFALATYLIGYRTLVEETKAAAPVAVVEPAATQWRVVFAIAVVIGLTVFQSIAYLQNTDMNLIWIDRDVNLSLFGWRFPVPWFNSIDSFVSIIMVPPLVWLWRWQDRRGGEPSEIAKISIGAWTAASANMLLVLGVFLSGTHVPVLYPIIYDFLLGVAFLYYWPTLLALVSRAAPPRLKATLMGCSFLSLFFGNIFVGWLGTFYEKMSPAAFWTMHAGIAAAGGLLSLVLAKPLMRMLAVNEG